MEGDSSSLFLKPFDSFDDCCIVLYIDEKFIEVDEKIRFQLVNKFFKKDYESEAVKKFISRAKFYKSKFPHNFINNFDLINNKLDELFQEVSNDSNIFIKCLKLKCMLCHEMSLDKCNIKYYAGQLYSHGNNSQKCFIVGNECI